MMTRHSLIYVGSRAVAAALNMASVAVFTRLAPTETYGAYLYVLSWSLVLYGATCQWPRFAFFALYDEAKDSMQVATMVRMLAGSVLLAGVGAALCAAAGLISHQAAFVILCLTFSTTVFEGSNEVARTHLKAGIVAAATLSRSVLIIGLGSAALYWTGDPLDLALAIAAANTFAALPTALSVVPMLGAGRA